MRIAVTTPLGHVGRHLTTALIRGGVRPTLLARSPAKIPHVWSPYVDVVKADSTQVAEVIAATRGVDAIYWVDPSVFSPAPLKEYARATESLVEGVSRNGIQRVVFQSSIGAEKRRGVGEIDGLAATEVALDALSVDVTHLRCGYFFTNLLLEREAIREGRLRTVLPVDHALSWVAPRDIAEVAALTLLNPTWHGRRVQAVHGPEDLAWRQVASILTAELGRDVVVEHVGDAEMRARYLDAGMPSGMADAVLGMSTGIRDDFRPEQRRTPVTTTPTSLVSWVRDELVPSLPSDAGLTAPQ